MTRKRQCVWRVARNYRSITFYWFTSFLYQITLTEKIMPNKELSTYEKYGVICEAMQERGLSCPCYRYKKGAPK